MKKSRLFLKSLSTLIGAYLLICQPIYGQEGGSGTMMLGFKSGLTTSRFYGAYVNDGALKINYHAGLVARFSIASSIAVSGEINYSRLGAANLHPDLFFALENKIITSPYISSDVTVNAINVPLYVTYTIPGVEGSVSPYISLGGDFNFNLYSTSVNTAAYVSDGEVYKFTTKTELGGKIKLFDPGVLAGTGFVFNGAPLSYIFDIRYKIGLGNINNSYSGYADNSLYTRAINFSFGIAYNF